MSINGTVLTVMTLVLVASCLDGGPAKHCLIVYLESGSKCSIGFIVPFGMTSILTGNLLQNKNEDDICSSLYYCICI